MSKINSGKRKEIKMSTRSAVGVWIGNPSEGIVNAVYHHSDGYPSGMGAFLCEQAKNGKLELHVLIENIISEKVGWSFFLDKDMRLQPIWYDYGPAGICHVRQQTANRINKMFQRFLERSDNKPFFITDQELMEKLTEQDAYEEKMSFGSQPRIPDVIKINIHDDESYELVSELTFTKDHPLFNIAKYLYYFAPKSYWERGEDFELRFKTVDDFKDSDTEYIYLFDLLQHNLWIYANYYRDAFPLDKPLIVIDLNKGFEGDWEDVSDGKYQKVIQTT